MLYSEDIYGQFDKQPLDLTAETYMYVCVLSIIFIYMFITWALICYNNFTTIFIHEIE